jgi:hypothetical protein
LCFQTTCMTPVQYVASSSPHKTIPFNHRHTHTGVFGPPLAPASSSHGWAQSLAGVIAPLPVTRRVLDLIVTNSSAALGWMPTCGKK